MVAFGVASAEASLGGENFAVVLVAVVGGAEGTGNVVLTVDAVAGFACLGTETFVVGNREITVFGAIAGVAVGV